MRTLWMDVRVAPNTGYRHRVGILWCIYVEEIIKEGLNATSPIYRTGCWVDQMSLWNMEEMLKKKNPVKCYRATITLSKSLAYAFFSCGYEAAWLLPKVRAFSILLMVFSCLQRACESVSLVSFFRGSSWAWDELYHAKGQCVPRQNSILIQQHSAVIKLR